MRFGLLLLLCCAIILPGCGEPGAQAAADEAIGFGYVKRDGAIHFVGGGNPGAGAGVGAEATRIDRPTEFNVKGFSQALGQPVKVCSAPDTATFEALSEEYTRDKNMVYYKWISPGRFLVVELTGADPKTFEVLGRDLARDKNHVWRHHNIQHGVDAKTVAVVNDGFVHKDALGVWYQHQRIEGADPGTFRHLGSGYYGDAAQVYWGPDAIEGADPATFKVLGDSFIAKDRAGVYRSGQPVTHLDPATCKLILHDPYGYQVTSDKDGVYLNRLPFLHADPADFKMVDNRTGRGGKYVFLVDTWHSTPVTVYRDGGRLVAETVFYEKGTTNALATVKAEVAGDGLTDVTLSPPPGERKARPVPDWQTHVFKRDDLVKQMKAAGKLLE